MPYSSYGEARRAAFQMWRGPACVYHSSDTDVAGGLSTLTLRMRQETKHSLQIESRAIYGGTDTEESCDALLRAMFWEKVTPEVVNVPPLRIPLTCVRITHAQAQRWIQRFTSLTTVIHPQSPPALARAICTLRIETDSVSTVFEQVWVFDNSQHTSLQQVWNTVWDEMAQMLEAETAVYPVEESFDEPDHTASTYDWQAYNPVLTHPRSTP